MAPTLLCTMASSNSQIAKCQLSYTIFHQRYSLLFINSHICRVSHACTKRQQTALCCFENELTVGCRPKINVEIHVNVRSASRKETLSAWMRTCVTLAFFSNLSQTQDRWTFIPLPHPTPWKWDFNVTYIRLTFMNN